MKPTYKILLLACLVVLATACEDVINVSLDESEPVLAIDGFITDQPGTQLIRVTQTQAYFDNTFTDGVPGAIVTVTDTDGRTYDFDDQGNGNYVWTPTGNEVMGAIGRGYSLRVSVQGQTYQATSFMNRVMPIDSIQFENRPSELGSPEGYYASVFARDFEGRGDTYWIRAFKNGVYLDKPEEINIAYDAAFSAGGNIDGQYLITPIREGINRFPDEAEDDDELAPLEVGDTVAVEIYSITNDTYFFFEQMRNQLQNGGLFALPLANVPTNIINANTSGPVAVGWFSASAVSTASTIVEERPLLED